MDRHARYEQLALSHVLGGLDRREADDFRSHLRGCVDCRSRVAELRGISSTLDAAARDERRRVAVEPPQRRDPPTISARPSSRRAARAALVALAVLALFLSGFWNLHLRTSADAYFATAQEQAAILRDLAAGRMLDDPTLGPVDARVAVVGSRVVVVIADGGPLSSDERLVAWLEPFGSSSSESVIVSVGPRATTEVAVRIDRGAASGLVVTRERGLLSSSGPRGPEVLRVRLPSLIPGT